MHVNIIFYYSIINRQKVLAGSSYRISTDNDDELFSFFFILASFLLHLLVIASSFYCISFLSAFLDLRLFFLILFLTRQKKQANQDRSGPFSFLALSNIWCRGIWLPISGFKDLIYSVVFEKNDYTQYTKHIQHISLIFNVNWQ